MGEQPPSPDLPEIVLFGVTTGNVTTAILVVDDGGGLGIVQTA